MLEHIDTLVFSIKICVLTLSDYNLEIEFWYRAKQYL